jgi:GNAT superfamily N-acetyltransferase
MIIRGLFREEIEKLSEIDRSEVVEFNYRLSHGKLELFDYYCEIKRFSETKLVQLKTGLYHLYDGGGAIYGALCENKLVGIASLDSRFRGENLNRLQLALLHVDKNYRKCGIGKHLVELVAEKARKLGAQQLYISAAPIKNTVEFYMKLGCKLTAELEADLFELEPEDIHMELNIK